MRRLQLRIPKLMAPRTDAATFDRLPFAALEFQSPTAAIIATPTPPMASYINWFVTAFILSVLIICGVVKTDKIVVATGVLTSTAPNYQIQSFGTESIVQSIRVHAGQYVTKGELLATLNPTYASADLTSLTQQQQSYSAQVSRLQDQEDGTTYSLDPNNSESTLQVQTYQQQIAQYNFTVQDYAQKISELKTNIAGYEAQASYYRQRLGIASNVETMRKDLQKMEVGSRLDTLAATDDRVNIQAQLTSAVSSADAATRQLAAQQAERDSFEQQWRATISQQLSEAIVNLAQAQQQLSKAKLQNQLVALTAPEDSIVQSVAPVSAGSILQTGETLIDLAPVDAPLTVEADINAAESGYVRLGDQVVIKFQTLPYLQFGVAEGTVESISPDSFNPLDQTAEMTNGPPLPGSPQSLYYKAQITLGALKLYDTPPGFRLVPGMPLEADMKVGTRTLLGYFLQRMLPVAYNSMHEP